MQRHDVASTLRRRCINVLCPLGWTLQKVSVERKYPKEILRIRGINLNPCICACSKTHFRIARSMSYLLKFIVKGMLCQDALYPDKMIDVWYECVLRFFANYNFLEHFLR